MGPLFARPGVRASVDDLLQAVAAGRIKVVIDRLFPWLTLPQPTNSLRQRNRLAAS